MRCRATQDFACTSFSGGARGERSLRFPQLHHTNGEHYGRGINLISPRQHFQKCNGLGQKLTRIFALAYFQQQSKGLPHHFLCSPGFRFHR